ncbi:hypothetical protein NEOLI_002118 [Neolecta irregularis DAH-3]|uniref:Sulfotransferase family protein n=1 Tax=Neolecta irregularis (strain DAH-3) TaxID=1198029 RepID=A0A1U7LU56_NEOID|nr:hypothetical protein NEOLI_002118 [Neolecta irregularis DAH-3]|eukprot:OLL26159.1 hypothetical protein NEOLI_002118 [Neolecta irregularis DAH-3]
MSKPIILWTHPRSTSTAFERAFMTRNDIECFHEPYGDVYYFAKDRMNYRYTEEEAKESGHWSTTWQDVSNQLLKEYPGKRVFVKDMAQYIIHPETHKLMVPVETLRKFTHTFLIRCPEKSVKSYYRCCTGEQSKKTGFKYFDPAENGYPELRALFNIIKEIDDTLVIESCQHLDNPQAAIEKFCKFVKLEYDSGMLDWKDDSNTNKFDKWTGFHDQVIKSNGFQKFERKDGTFPEIVQKTINDVQKHYDYLKQFVQ